MSTYSNVTVLQGKTKVATGASTELLDDAQTANLWGLGSAQLTSGSAYLLNDETGEFGPLEWTGTFTGKGEGTASAPFVLVVSDSGE